MSAEHTSVDGTLRAAARKSQVADLDGARLDVALLRDLLTSDDRTARHLWIRNARFSEVLALDALQTMRTLTFENCTFEHAILLSDFKGGTFRILGGVAERVLASGLRLSGDLHLGRGLRVNSGVVLSRARVDGQVDLSASTLRAGGGESALSPEPISAHARSRRR